jgi:hypothetical protein
MARNDSAPPASAFWDEGKGNSPPGSNPLIDSLWESRGVSRFDALALRMNRPPLPPSPSIMNELFIMKDRFGNCIK